MGKGKLLCSTSFFLFVLMLRRFHGAMSIKSRVHFFFLFFLRFYSTQCTRKCCQTSSGNTVSHVLSEVFADEDQLFFSLFFFFLTSENKFENIEDVAAVVP